MTEWYVMKDGRKHGPVSTAVLKQLARTGQLQPTDNIWREGLDSWVAASRAKGLPFTSNTAVSVQENGSAPQDGGGRATASDPSAGGTPKDGSGYPIESENTVQQSASSGEQLYALEGDTSPPRQQAESLLGHTESLIDFNKSRLPNTNTDRYKKWSDKELGNALNNYVILGARTTTLTYGPSILIGLLVLYWQGTAYNYVSGLLFGTLTAFITGYLFFILYATLKRDEEFIALRMALAERRKQDIGRPVYHVFFTSLFLLPSVLYIVLVMSTTLASANTLSICLIVLSAFGMFAALVEWFQYQITPKWLLWPLLLLNLCYLVPGITFLRYKAELEPRQKNIISMASAISETKPSFAGWAWEMTGISETTKQYLQDKGIQLQIPPEYIKDQKPDIPWVIMYEENAFEVNRVGNFPLWGRAKAWNKEWPGGIAIKPEGIEVVAQTGHLVLVMDKSSWEKLNWTNGWEISKAPRFEYQVISTDQLNDMLKVQEETAKKYGRESLLTIGYNSEAQRK